jgi:hypothetical protein
MAVLGGVFGNQFQVRGNARYVNYVDYVDFWKVTESLYSYLVLRNGALSRKV